MSPEGGQESSKEVWKSLNEEGIEEAVEKHKQAGGKEFVIPADPGKPPKLERGESIYAAPKAGPHEVPGIDTMYVEVILQKLLSEKMASAMEVAILKKLYLEHKSPEQTTEELRKEYGPGQGIAPQNLELVVRPLEAKVQQKFGYEFPAYSKVRQVWQIEGIKQQEKNDRPFVDELLPANRIHSTEKRRLLEFMSEATMSHRLKGVEADLFIAFWYENASLQDLADILKKHSVPNAGPHLARLKISVIVEDLLKEARRQEHEKTYPESKDSKFKKGVKKVIGAIARIWQ